MSTLSILSLRNENLQWEVRENIAQNRDCIAIDLELLVLLQKMRSTASEAVLTQETTELVRVSQEFSVLLENLASLSLLETESSLMQSMLGPLTDENLALSAVPLQWEQLRNQTADFFNKINLTELALDHRRASLESHLKNTETELGELHTKAMTLNIVLLTSFSAFLWLLAHQSKKKSEMHKIIESSEKLHRLIFSSVHEGIVLCTQDGFITAANPQMAKFLNLAPSLLKGAFLHEIMPPLKAFGNDTEGFTRQPLSRILNTRAPADRVIWGVQRSQGQNIWLQFSTFPLEFSASDQYRSFLISVADITENVDNAKTIEQQRAQMANRAKFSALGELATGLAHEINNPLSKLVFETEVFKEQFERDNLASKDNVKTFIEQILNSVQRVSKIIKGIRIYARDGQEDEFADENLYSLVQETLQILNHRMIEIEIQIITDRLQKDLVISCRSTQIVQILVNLVGNAIDAIAEDVRINPSPSPAWIRFESQIVQDYVHISVINSGPKIPEAIRPKLFEAFFTTKFENHGTGLGLSISRNLARGQGGDLILQEDSESTRFTIKLPHWRQGQISEEQNSAA